ncbi:hypothetical protein APA386B_1570 [Acetobacter pasteurianus 386B]|nr:hypothetical protein APA386B_1570 [Acetobacter pasteurianus 386B]
MPYIFSYPNMAEKRIHTSYVLFCTQMCKQNI